MKSFQGLEIKKLITLLTVFDRGHYQFVALQIQRLERTWRRMSQGQGSFLVLRALQLILPALYHQVRSVQGLRLRILGIIKVGASAPHTILTLNLLNR